MGHATFIVGDSRAHVHMFLNANDSVQVTVVFNGHKKLASHSIGLKQSFSENKSLVMQFMCSLVVLTCMAVTSNMMRYVTSEGLGGVHNYGLFQVYRYYLELN